MDLCGCFYLVGVMIAGIAIVAAAALVVKNVPADTIISGNPTTII